MGKPIKESGPPRLVKRPVGSPMETKFNIKLA